MRVELVKYQALFNAALFEARPILVIPSIKTITNFSAINHYLHSLDAVNSERR